ncbi:MAG: AAA family ATPase [Promethearchaeota archaeon]
MTIQIGVSGKGGTGKTTLLSLILKDLLLRGEDDIFVLDGDPDSNMPDILGINPPGTLADITDALREKIGASTTSPLMAKDRYLEGELFRIISEQNGYDLLVTGSVEKQGCFCVINSQLKVIIDRFANQYKYTILDLPAGLEHLNRRVIRDIDVLFVISDASRMGITTIGRIIKLTKKLQIKVKRLVLIGNRSRNGTLEKMLKEVAEENRVEYGGVLPYDSEIEELNLLGPTILNIKESNPTLQIVHELVEKYLN